MAEGNGWAAAPALAPERLALGLPGLWERAAQADPATAALPIRDIAFGGMWLVVRLEGNHVGRAFMFTGAHEVYGPFDFGALERMQPLIGQPVSAAFAWATSPDAGTELGAIVADGLALACLNAASAPGNEPAALETSGLELLDDCVGSLVRPSDRVAVVGAGMFMRELRQSGATVDVIDMRPACDLMCAHVTAAGVETAPQGLRFHGVEDTEALFAQADVLFLTGCTLVNGTFFELMALPRRARDVVMFGPSSGAPFEALAELGVTCVASSAVVDADGLIDATLRGAAARQVPQEITRPYVVTVPRS